MASNRKRTYGKGSVYSVRDKDGRIISWVAQIRVPDSFGTGSKKIRRHAPTRYEADELLKQLQAASPDQFSDPSKGVTVADWLDVYATRTLPVTDLKASTKQGQLSSIRHPLKESLGLVKLADFDPATAEEWLARLHDCKSLQFVPVPEGEEVPKVRERRELAGSSKRSAFYVLKTALDVAVRDGLIPANPLVSLKAPKTARGIAPFFTPVEFDKVLRTDLKKGRKRDGIVQPRRLQPLVEFLYGTGCRLGEALGLRWSDLDLEAGTALIVRSGPGEDSPKTGRFRKVVLANPESVHALKAWKNVQNADRLATGEAWANSDGLVFTTESGLSPDPHNLRRDFKAMLEPLGLLRGRPFHALRHGFAHRMLASGARLYVVSDVLGHASIEETVNTYGHVAQIDYADDLRKWFSAG